MQSAKLNGQTIDRSWFTHAEIINGGTLELNMGERPSGWGIANLPKANN